VSWCSAKHFPEIGQTVVNGRDKGGCAREGRSDRSELRLVSQIDFLAVTVPALLASVVGGAVSIAGMRRTPRQMD
jgi:hypothetical protein